MCKSAKSKMSLFVLLQGMGTVNRFEIRLCTYEVYGHIWVFQCFIQGLDIASACLPGSNLRPANLIQKYFYTHMYGLLFENFLPWEASEFKPVPCGRAMASSENYLGQLEFFSQYSKKKVAQSKIIRVIPFFRVGISYTNKKCARKVEHAIFEKREKPWEPLK